MVCEIGCIDNSDCLCGCTSKFCRKCKIRYCTCEECDCTEEYIKAYTPNRTDHTLPGQVFFDVETQTDIKFTKTEMMKLFMFSMCSIVAVTLLITLGYLFFTR